MTLTPSSLTAYQSWKCWSRERFGICSAEEALYFSAEVGKIGFKTLTGKRVLEIGFGNGEFAGWVTKQGANYSGTERIADLVAVGRSNGFDMHDATCNLESIGGRGAIELVVAFDVFEHLETTELVEVLASIRQTLKPGGLLLARVPSGDSPFSGAIQCGDLTHRTSLGSSAIRQLAEVAGYEVISIREPAFPVLGVGVRSLLRRAVVVMARRLVYPLIRRLMIGNEQAIMSPNMIFVLRSN